MRIKVFWIFLVFVNDYNFVRAVLFLGDYLFTA